MRKMIWWLIPFYLYAGDHVGNGGHALNCKGVSGKMRYELLDLFEARDFYNLDIDMGQSHLSIKEKIDLALTRLSRLDFERAKRYRSDADFVFKNAKLLADYDFQYIADHLTPAIPTGCRIEQFAIQSHLKKNREFVLYLIKKEIWDQVDNDNRAALILHEVVYKEALAMGHTNSRRTRRFLSHFLSLQFETLTLEEYQTLEKEMGFSRKN